MATYLGDFQYGVGVLCVGEAILHSVNRLLEEKGGRNNMYMVLVDFSNAFNLVDITAMIYEVRCKCPTISKWVEFCYTSPAKLLLWLFYIILITRCASKWSLKSVVVLFNSTSPCAENCWAVYFRPSGVVLGHQQVIPEGVVVPQHQQVLFWPKVDDRSIGKGVFSGAYSKSKGWGQASCRSSQYEPSFM